ncbi:YjaG family protein [Celerinatantimonas yamalensis]|uniref:YjaG family protein n=1 Tax=Celerinatantimonas yamalensis TaxID=559956 RepID=A0ABW9GAG7_9GAMM
MLSDSFLTQLGQLQRLPQTLFCVCLTQRMMPNYQLFAESTEFASGQALRKYLDLFWEYLAYPKARINFALQREQFEPLIPERNHFDVYGVYPAIDCCVSFDVLFSSILAPEGDEACQASQISMGSVMNFLEMQFGELGDEQFSQQPLIEQELAFQQRCYDLACAFKRDHNFIKEVREIARHEDVSNLGVCLRDE